MSDWNPYEDLPHYEGNPKWGVGMPDEEDDDSWDDEWLEKVKAKIIQRFPNMTGADAERWMIGGVLLEILAERNKDGITFSLSKTETDENGVAGYRLFCPDDSYMGCYGNSLVKAVVREP